jgi:hypothetical protein
VKGFLSFFWIFGRFVSDWKWEMVWAIDDVFEAWAGECVPGWLAVA